MKRSIQPEAIAEMTALAAVTRGQIARRDYDVCETALANAMFRYPHYPQPHNLMGILMEALGDHDRAMKHFRAAWALDPTYRPAGYNLSLHTSFFPKGGCAFDEEDCPPLAI